MVEKTRPVKLCVQMLGVWWVHKHLNSQLDLEGRCINEGNEKKEKEGGNIWLQHVPAQNNVFLTFFKISVCVSLCTLIKFN